MFPSSLFRNINLVQILITLGIIVLVFLLIREILTWYWKINKVVSLLEDIKRNTRKETKKPEDGNTIQNEPLERV